MYVGLRAIYTGNKCKAHLSGLAKIRWPIVTKLASWLNMNQAIDDTLYKCKRSNEYTSIDNILDPKKDPNLLIFSAKIDIEMLAPKCQTFQ